MKLPLLLVASMAVGATSARAAAPPAGRYDGQLCVTTSAEAPSCGPVEVDLDARGAASVLVNDIVYRLKLRPTKVDVVLMQGPMQLDEFSVPYEWKGAALQFADDEKSARYELRFGKRRR
jgi:hypothetical protein